MLKYISNFKTLKPDPSVAFGNCNSLETFRAVTEFGDQG